MATIQLGNKTVGNDNPTYIIAEIGINHQGSVDLAKELIEAAHGAGADAVKFQKRSLSRILTKEGLEMPYENRHSFGKTYGEHKKNLELSFDDYHDLKEFSSKFGLDFVASGWDEESIDFLYKLGVPFFKMASADLSNFPLLEHTAKKKVPIIISTGMADMELVTAAVFLLQNWNDQLGILQCTSTYPSVFEEINLRVIPQYTKAFQSSVIGYSGHEAGIAIPPVAVALGARIVERHFTLDRSMKGGDQAASLEPQGFQKMVRDIRHVEAAMGKPEKQLQESEKLVFKKLAKSVVSAVAMPKGTEITRTMLTTKGPGSGISPTKLDALLGKKAALDIPEDQVLTNDMIEW